MEAEVPLPQSPGTPKVCLVSTMHPWTPANRYPSPAPNLLFPVPLPSSPASLRLKAEVDAHYSDPHSTPSPGVLCQDAMLLEEEDWESQQLQSILRRCPSPTAELVTRHYADNAFGAFPQDQLEEEEACLELGVNRILDDYYFQLEYERHYAIVGRGPYLHPVDGFDFDDDTCTSRQSSDDNSSVMDCYEPYCF